jgi:glucose/arabinose dehydrogenase
MMSGGMPVRMRIGLVVGCLIAVLATAARADAIGLQPVGTFNSPIYVTSPPGDPRLFVVERGGTIQALHDGTSTQFLDISALTTTDGERGLLSMAFDPNYTGNGLFYVFYTGDGVDAGGALGDIHIDEFHVSSNPNVADAGTRRTVMTFPHSASNHNGGQLQFGKDGLLYITIGDNANGANAQSLTNQYGKVLRIDPHGSGQGVHGIPASNPFVASPTPEIWSLGLRNPFRFSFDHLSGDLIIGDVGAGAREEVDFSPASSGGGGGANYGWPNCEGFSGFPGSCPGTVGPVLDYPRTPPCNAIIGGYVYRGNQIPELAGRYLYTDLCHPELRSTQLGLPLASGDRSEGISAPDSPNSFGEDSSCNLYVMGSDVVDRIVSSNPPAVSPSCQATAKKRCKRHKKKRPKAAATKTAAGSTASAKKKHKKKHCKKKKRKKKKHK